VSGKFSRDKGARAERAVVSWLRANGVPDARRYSGADGHAPGDIDAFPAVVLEVKDCVKHDIPAWMRQAQQEAGPLRIPVVVVKPRGVTNVGQWWAILPFHELVELVRD
jgi:hypothetical protein